MQVLEAYRDGVRSSSPASVYTSTRGCDDFCEPTCCDARMQTHNIVRDNKTPSVTVKGSSTLLMRVSQHALGQTYLAHIKAATRHVDAAGCTLAALAAAGLGSRLRGRAARLGRRCREARNRSVLGGVLWWSAAALGALGGGRRRGLGRHGRRDDRPDRDRVLKAVSLNSGESHRSVPRFDSRFVVMSFPKHKTSIETACGAHCIRLSLPRYDSPSSIRLACRHFLCQYSPRFLLLR
jgi:hypothetical protein